MNNSVKVPYSYFVKSAQRDYSCPTEAFFREFLQNSVDAESRNITFNIYRENDKTYFSCVDDGCGMTEDIIRNKLLTLGETSKDSNATGGFGVAKILIYFSHPAYQIYSQDNIVIGSGGTYSITKSDTFINGTKSIVEINPEIINDYSDVDYIHNRLKQEIQRSYLPKVNITINGEKIDTFLKQGRQVTDLSDITIHKKILTDTECYALVRVNGLHMFRIWCGEQKFQLVIELKNYSINILTTNRDGFRSEWSSKVRQAIDDICQNPAKSKTQSKTNFYRGKSERTSPWTEDALTKVSNYINDKLALGSSEDLLIELDQNIHTVLMDAGLNAAEQTQANAIKQAIDKQINSGIQVNLTVYDLQEFLQYNVYIKTIGNYRKVPTLWQPDKFSDKQKNLLSLWGKVVGLVLRDTGNQGINYDVGYVFDDGTQGDVALAQYEKSYAAGKTLHIFYLNPTKYDDQSYFPGAANRKTEVVLWLMTIAIHEVTHYMGCSGHNNDFVATEAGLKLKVLKNIQEYLSL